jgi:hypothetical protein
MSGRLGHHSWYHSHVQPKHVPLQGLWVYLVHHVEKSCTTIFLSFEEEGFTGQVHAETNLD